MQSMITLDTYIEELVESSPSAVNFLMDHGIRCLLCGEPAWGTLGDAMQEKGIPEARRLELLNMLNEHIQEAEGAQS